MVGMAAIMGLWAFHLTYPSYLFSLHGVLVKAVVIIVLSLPFLTVFSIARLLLPEIQIPERSKPGMLFTHLQREDSIRRWKIMIAAGIISVFNLVAMLALSVPPRC